MFYHRKPVIIKTNRENGELNMSKIFFNEFQRKQLENNPNVIHVSDRFISYKPEFIIAAVIENQNGKEPTEIFIENGFDLDIIGSYKPQQCLKRWRKYYIH